MYKNNTNYIIRQNKIVYLNTDKATKTTSGTRNTSFTWFIDPINILDYAVLRIESISHHNTGSTNNAIYTFKIDDVLFNSRCYYNTDNCGATTIATCNFNGESNINYSSFALTLQPQNLNKITMYVSDNITNHLAGVPNGYSFVIALVIEEYDLIYDEIGKSLGEARKDFINAEKKTSYR